MLDRVKKDVLYVLNNSYGAIKNKDVFELKRLSDMTLHNAGMFQDKDSIRIAVVIYSLAKIYDRKRKDGYENWGEFVRLLINKFKTAADSLKNDRYGEYDSTINEIIKTIVKTEKSFSIYVTEVINQAKIKKAGRIYEHGISIGRTAELLGVNKWDLMTYVGQTKVPDEYREAIGIRKRIELTRRVFS